ncbi:hypothetical protein CSUI_000939 [Cystoisospora suis]|uniref:Uncharacterized protein n=1 Tax=Cystoisospora suis TaxID=483139 RepID=A0A2C6LC47_9APIC|nr:hypothetical protein CSUI_000939 [Cystoisospora suis]
MTIRRKLVYAFILEALHLSCPESSTVSLSRPTGNDSNDRRSPYDPFRRIRTERVPRDPLRKPTGEAASNATSLQPVVN